MSKQNNQKPKDFKGGVKKLLKFVKPERFLLIAGLLFAILYVSLTIFCPKLLGDITNELQDSIDTGIIDMQLIGKIGILLVILYSVSSLVDYICGVLMSKAASKIGQRFRRAISVKMNKIPLSYYDKSSIGDILSRITNDVSTITSTLEESLAGMLASLVKVVGVLVIMFVLSWKMALVALVTVPLSAVAMMVIIKFSQKYFAKQQKSIGEINGHIEEVYNAHNVVKVFGGEQKAIDQFEKINKDIMQSGFKSHFFSGLMYPISNFISNIGFILVCIVGGISVLGGDIRFGAITSFMLYIRQLNQPLSQIASIAGTLQSTVAASERVFEFLDVEEEPDESQKNVTIPNVQGMVEFKDVCFGYTKGKEIIHNFSLKALPGQKIAIVGPTGAGKTTLVNLLMRFYEIDSGQILIDCTDTSTMKRENVRELFGMVLQDTWLFEGTIKENIAYGNQDVPMQTIIDACKMANIDHFIKTLPEGYDKVLDESISLSQGQKQLMTIARAMVDNAPMLILDEATSSVDTRTEILIQDAMDKLMKGRTSFVIAHRLSTIQNADTILVMKDGNIVEIGNHQTLLEAGGAYAELYNSQFSGK